MPPRGASIMRATDRIWPARRQRLSPEAQAIDKRAVALGVGLLDIGQKTAALAHQFQEATAGMIVLDVALEMFGQVGDALREDRNLDLRRAGIGSTGSVFLDQ